MDKDFIETLVACFEHLEKRVSFIRPREPHQHQQVLELTARLRQFARNPKGKTRE